MERIRVNLIPKGLPPVCHASQYDDGRVIRFDIMDDLEGYILSDEEIELEVRKPDGHLVTSSVTVETGKTYVDIVTTEQMCAVVGDNECKLKISKDGAEIYTILFKMRVQKSVTEGGDPSESFIHDLNEQIYEAVADQYSGDVIFDPAPTASHGEGYAVTSEGVLSAIENIEIGDLKDVTISGAVEGEALVFNSEGEIVNGTVSTVGSIDDLSDVDTTGKGNDYSLVYNTNDAEWQAKKLTVEVTQAEYDQLKLDGDLVEGVHYVITDGQDVTCDLGDLNDVDTTGASTGDILVKGASGWESSGVEDISSLCTFNTDWVFPSWGFYKVLRFGKIIQISVFGASYTGGISQATTLVTLPNTAKISFQQIIVYGASNSINIATIDASSNEVKISPYGGDYIRLNMVIMVN